MNKNQDSIIDSKYLLANQHQKNLLANQHQIMAIGHWETSPKTEEQKPANQKLKSDISSSTPRTNGLNMKKAPKNTVSKAKNLKNSISKSKSLDLVQNGQEIGVDIQEFEDLPKKPNPDKENSVLFTKNEIDYPKLASNSEQILENSCLSDWEDLYDSSHIENLEDLETSRTLSPSNSEYYDNLYGDENNHRRNLIYPPRDMYHNEPTNSEYDYFYDCIKNEELDNPSTQKMRPQFNDPKKIIYKKIEHSNQMETKPTKLGYTTHNNVKKNELQNTKNPDLIKTNYRSGSGLKYNKIPSRKFEIKFNRPINSYQRQHGYMSICLIFCNDMKQHCILSTNSIESFIPRHLLKYIAPNRDLPSYIEKGRKKLKLKFNAMDIEDRIIPLQFGFSISNQIRYPVLGADFIQSPIFQKLEKNSMVLLTSEGTIQIPVYLSTASNEWRRTMAHENYNAMDQEIIPASTTIINNKHPNSPNSTKK